MYRMFEMIIMDSKGEPYKHVGAYTSIKVAKELANGNGELIRIKDVTADFPISENCIFETLALRFGKEETQAMTNILREVYENIV